MRYVYSGTSGAASLQQFVESNVYHRQGKAKLSFSIFVFFFHVLYTLLTMVIRVINVFLPLFFTICNGGN